MSLLDRLKIFTKFQIIFEILTLAVNLGTGVFLISMWKHIPEQIPTHFGAAGEADAYGSKGSLIFLFVMMLVLSLMLIAATLFPNLWNMPGKITENNSVLAYRYIRTMMCSISLIIALLFSYMLICSALSRSLGSWFLPVTLAVLFGDVIFFTVKTARLPK